jgi:uncharacterized membrane protein YdjX (TVP38/TMEM64 family)
MNRARAAILLVLAATLAIAAYMLPIAEWTTALAERVRGAGLPGVILFVAAYVVATVVLLPGSLLTLAAGFAYGPAWGVAVASPASIAGATAAFLLGRTLLHDWATRRVSKSAHLRAISRAVEHEAFKIVFLTRLSPLIPFDVLNYAFSLTKVRLRTYVAASAIGMLPGTVLYVYLGSLAPTAAQLSSAGADGSMGRVVLYAAGLGATIAVVVIATRAAKRALRTELERAA